MKTPPTAIATLIIGSTVFLLLVASLILLALTGHGDDQIAVQLLLIVGLLGTAIVGTIAGGRIAYYQGEAEQQKKEEKRKDDTHSRKGPNTRS